MSQQRKKLNLYLIFLTLILGGLAAGLTRLPNLVFLPHDEATAADPVPTDTLSIPAETAMVAVGQPTAAAEAPDSAPAQRIEPQSNDLGLVRTTSFKDVEARTMTADHPFRAEAIKVLSGRLEESDSLRRRKILSYCEHLRTAYTTRDIDFIRQVFSDNALIIVGHVVRTGEAGDMNCSERVRYGIRSKKEYIERLARIFATKKEIDVKFSDFKIMRHPTVEGIYGVTLRQKYVCDSYSDDGYLFLLWDFRDASMPQIHVRTWQPALSLGDDGETIDISDFNLE